MTGHVSIIACTVVRRLHSEQKDPAKTTSLIKLRAILASAINYRNLLLLLWIFCDVTNFDSVLLSCYSWRFLGDLLIGDCYFFIE